MSYLLAIDQGTSSSRAMLFDPKLRMLASAQQEFPQHFPKNGWVEHDPEAIWDSVVTTMRRVLAESGTEPRRIAGIGLTNQRETVVVWDRDGKAIHPAIVWQDRRTVEICARLAAGGLEEVVRDRTGLVIDPYFSATKIAWILDHVPGARDRAARGELFCGTIDSFLIWRLTGGRVHATDATNASRTMLYDIHKGRWSTTLCAELGIPLQMLPEVRDSAADFGTTEPALLGVPVPVCGVAGDQQAAALGQACFEPGTVKATYGTGSFVLLNTGATPVRSEHRLLTTIACQLKGKPAYALEGSIFVAGSGVQWLRDALGLIERADQSQVLAAQADPGQRLILVPAFVGLGAPYWDSACRGALFGLTRGAGPAEFARATLESVGFQTRDLLEALQADYPQPPPVLRVDGGMAASDWTMQFLADVLELPVERPENVETSALGAAWLAGLQSGAGPDQAEFAAGWHMNRRFTPRLRAEEGLRLRAAWRAAVAAARMVPAVEQDVA